MSIPNTDEVVVARIAAALEITMKATPSPRPITDSSYEKSVERHQEFFNQLLTNFETAYKRIRSTTVADSF